MAAEAPCPVRSYAEAVLSGAISAGRLVKLACARHLHDLEHGHERGLKWDADAALRVLNFFSKILKLNSGGFEGQPFVLLGWQGFIIGSLHGWIKEDGTRRYRTVYCETSKGSGKTPLAAGEGIVCLVADGEPGAEVYVAATKEDQAAVAFRHAVKMVNASPSLKSKIAPSGGEGQEWNLAYHKTGSFMRRIGSDKKSQSGPMPHCAILDEIHEHKTDTMVNMMTAGIKSRRQPIIFEITNAGEDRNTICWRHHEYAAKILDGFDKEDGIKDDSFFGYVCQLDVCEKHAQEGHEQPVEGCKKCDDWKDEKVWIKTNPSLPHIPSMEYLRSQVLRAKNMPTDQSLIKRLNFCVWTSTAEHAIPMDAWNACARPLDIRDFAGKPCFYGADLGATSDFTAVVQLFPHDDEEEVELRVNSQDEDFGTVKIIRRSYTMFPHFWIPEQPRMRDANMMQVIKTWIRQGLITTTPGNVVDYTGVVIKDVLRLCQVNPPILFAVDYAFQGVQFCTDLKEHLGDDKVEIFRNGIISMNAPFREMIELVMVGRWHHGGHPVMTWMAGNCAARKTNGLIMPDKDKSTEKIDGVSACCYSLGVAIGEPAEVSGGGFEAW